MNTAQRIAELEEMIADLSAALAAERESRRAQILELVSQRDKLLAQAEAENMWTGLLDDQKEALRRVVAAESIASTAAVGEPGGSQSTGG
jgi:hypothetical protein